MSGKVCQDQTGFVDFHLVTHRLEADPRVKQAVGTNNVCACLCHPEIYSWLLEKVFGKHACKSGTDLTAHSPAETPDRSPFGPMAIVAAIGFLY